MGGIADIYKELGEAIYITKKDINKVLEYILDLKKRLFNLEQIIIKEKIK